MLAYILALAVGFGSLSLYLSAFLFPEIYRKYDLLWSGLGLFYALVLWTCAGRITGSLLLGQMASGALLGWLGWQTLSLRFSQTPAEQRIQLQGDSLQAALRAKFTQLQLAFEDGSWRTYMAYILDQLPAQAADLARTLQGWMEALISTTLKPQEFSVESNSPSATSDTVAEVKARGSYGEETDEGSDRAIAAMPPINSVAATSASAPAAEWDDLEPEIYPDMETIDGPGWDFHAPSLRGQEPNPQDRPQISDEHADSR